MDVSVLHLAVAPERDYRWKDRLNSMDGHLSCRLLEWTGWYNQDILQRLLGHYRLYQLFKVESSQNDHLLSPPLPLAYIASYRASHRLKYALSSITASIHYLVLFGKRYRPLQIEGLNRLLVTNQAVILHQFLQDAEKDFSHALAKAIEPINAPGFLQRTQQPITFIQQNRHYTTSSHYFNEYITVQAAVNGAKGKEKGVFSKKQLLILFDLLAESKVIEKIDYNKPNKFTDITAMLQAVSGKGKDSILEELKDTHKEGCIRL